MNKGAAVAAVTGLLVLVAGCGDSEAKQERELANRQKESAGVCHDAVKTYLKSPGTAQFSEEERVGDPNTSMQVKGAVDSQNTYGGVVRNEWTCTVRLVGDQWKANAHLTTSN